MQVPLNIDSLRGTPASMLLTLFAFALAETPSEEVCVVAARTASDVRVERPPDAVRGFRNTIAEPDLKLPVPEVSLGDLLAVSQMPEPPRTGPHPGGFTFEAAAMRDPRSETRAYVTVRSQGPDKALAPLRLTFVIDTSPSMNSVFLRDLPALQDSAPDGSYRAVTRLELAKASLRSLVARLPDRAVVAVVAIDRGRSELLLPPTPIAQAARIHRAILRASPILRHTKGALDVIEKLALEGGDPCADTRILLMTDANARISPRLDEAQKRVVRWYEEGASLWTVSLGVLVEDTSQAKALTAYGRGLHLTADTLSEAVQQLVQSLYVSGVVGRNLSLEIQPNPERVQSLRRLDRPSPKSARGLTVAEIHAGREVRATYELTLRPDAPPGPLASVKWGVDSAYPGEWRADDELELTEVPAEESAPWLRDDVVAVVMADGLAHKDTTDWEAVATLTRRLAGPVGMAREYAAWARHLAPPLASGPGGLPFELPEGVELEP